MRTIIATIIMLAAAGAAQAMTGKQVAQIYAKCVQDAHAGCRWNSNRCNAYRATFVKVCLVEQNVPPEYIGALLN